MIETKCIKIDEKKYCSGCTACVAVCPKGCISMQEDEEGFLYPVVDISICIQCSKCIKTCPYASSKFTNKTGAEELAICYTAYNKDAEIRYNSASGGMFRAFADRVIAEGGIVFGAAFDEKFAVEHTYTETLEGLTALMGSKYLQSRMGDTFALVKQYLKEGRKVLFTGCGCQIAGLKRFLNIEDANLICIDLICHGVDSPKIWFDYLHSLFLDDYVKYVNFRDKVTGQDNSSICIIGYKSKFYERKRNSIYFRSWKYGLFLRPSCEVCPFKSDNRVSDITIGDCWGFQKIAPEMYDDKGLSSLIIHSAKGKLLFDAIAPGLIFKETSIDDVKLYNSDYIKSQPFIHSKRAAFWEDYHQHKIPFDKLLEKHLGENKKVLEFIKKIVKECLALLKGLRS